ncbi:hypothetical protein [Comamonas jiangduensis]|uniref:hypothetical protein n=1 Tax=Comamonas jiangduensis TaxID=1194168 RepID=UPI003BF82932
MTASTTEQERAEFEAWYIAGVRKRKAAFSTWSDVEIRDGCMAPSNEGYRVDSARTAWDAWQAARRAQAVAVPQWLIDIVVPAIDPTGLDHNKHHCEYALYKDRERIRRELAAAPQPPEAAPVPQFSRIAQKKLDYLLEAGEAITGYAIENKDGRRGAIDCHGFVYWWQDAAAPQPPEAAQLDDTNVADMAQAVDSKEAAPVQLPEPVAKIEGDSLKWHIPDAGYSLPVRYLQGTQMLYTEQQVRELLAAHGIKEQST